MKNKFNLLKLIFSSLLVFFFVSIHGQNGCPLNSSQNGNFNALNNVSPIQMCGNTAQNINSSTCSNSYFWYRMDLQEDADIIYGLSCPSWQAFSAWPSNAVFEITIYHLDGSISAQYNPPSIGIDLAYLVVNSFPAGSYWVKVQFENINGLFDGLFTCIFDPAPSVSCLNCPNNSSYTADPNIELSYINPTMLCDGISQYVNSSTCANSYFWYRLILQEETTISLTVLNNANNCSGGVTGGFISYTIYEENNLNSPFYPPSSTNGGTISITLPPGNYWTLVYIEDICGNLDFSFSPDLPCYEVCENCIGSFNPEPGVKYLLAAWTMEEGAAATTTHYNDPRVTLNFYDANNNDVTPTTLIPFTTMGSIIDGWQRIEEEFTVPLDAVRLTISLESLGADVLFDDIRVLPFDGSMKSYVYDPKNMRLAAELDERHYATFYEYDEEGKLVRIKKETQKGIMTIKESKNNTSKP